LRCAVVGIRRVRTVIGHAGMPFSSVGWLPRDPYRRVCVQREELPRRVLVAMGVTPLAAGEQNRQDGQREEQG
jgi:hypothetical protein